MPRPGVKQKVLIIVGAVALAAGGAIGGYYVFKKPRKTTPISADEAKDLLREKKIDEYSKRLAVTPPEERRKMMSDQDLRKEYETLSDADREKLRSAMWESRRQEMKKEMDTFFAAPPEKQNEILDKQIDRMTEMRKQWEERRAANEAKQDSAKKDGGKKAGEQKGGNRRDRFKNASHEQKNEWARERLNRTDPAERARMMAYFQRLRKRMEERGISFGRPGGGRPGR